MATDVLTYYIDETAPKIVRTLSTQGEGELDVISQMSFRLRVRPQWSSQTVLDVPMESDVALDEVSYQPVVGDFDAEGVYRGWIVVDLGAGVVQSTDEFQINVFAHAPGQGTSIGAVWRACRALEPVAWDALRYYPEYGDPELQRVIDLAKLRVTGAVVPVDNEASLDPRVVDFIAKKVLADNVLSAAVSFWSNQFIAQTARGNSEEVATYPDRIGATERAIKRYREDLAMQAAEVDELTGVVSTYDAPAVNYNGPLATPGLDEYHPMPVSWPGWRG